ncbi:hypothetical protein [Microbulbifer sp. JMSA002]|uniref:hypothetical protein n=1 Tax=Microbulbifer sp. JMSA002 TaxID=3243368 RepID=UPI004039C772
MNRFILLILLFLPVVSAGTTLPRVEIGELLDRSDVTAIVRIENGSTLGTEEKPCGVSYKAKVINPIKNSKVGEYIEFGYFIGHGLGNYYLVFLNRKESVFRPLMSTNSTSQAAEAELRKNCLSSFPDLIVMHSGYGIRKLERPSENGYKDAILLPTRYVDINTPEKLLETEREICYSWENCKWIAKEYLLEYLGGQK